MRKTVLILTLLMLSTAVTAQSNSEIDIELKKTEPVPLKSSEYGTVWLEVRNSGGSANNVGLEFLENYPFEVVRGEKKSWDLGTLSPGEEYQIRLEVRVDENAVQGNDTSLRFRVERPSFSYTDEVPVEIRADNNILAVSKVDFADKIAPGQTRELGLELQNMADAQLKNIEAELSVPNETPVVTEGASTRNLRSIGPGETAELNYMISADQSATNGVYSLPLELTYENEAGTEFTKQSDVGLVIGGTPQLEAGISGDEKLSPGTTSTVTLRLVNRGEGRASFTQITLEDSENHQVLSPKTTYIGDMDPDDFQTAEYQIRVSGDAENLELPVHIEYKTDEGDQNDTQIVRAETYSQQELRQLGLAGNNPVLPIAALGLVLVAGAYFWRRRKRRQEQG